MPTTMSAESETDRVRRSTPAEVQRNIEEQIEKNIRFYAAQPQAVIADRIEELRREWSIERYLQVNVSTLGLLTAVMGLVSGRKWAILSCGATGFLLYQGLRGFEPPVSLLRKMGIRTRKEIDREIHGLKALRGDFQTAPVERTSPAPPPVAEILRALAC